MPFSPLIRCLFARYHRLLSGDKKYICVCVCMFFFHSVCIWQNRPQKLVEKYMCYLAVCRLKYKYFTIYTYMSCVRDRMCATIYYDRHFHRLFKCAPDKILLLIHICVYVPIIYICMCCICVAHDATAWHAQVFNAMIEMRYVIYSTSNDQIYVREFSRFIT